MKKPQQSFPGDVDLINCSIVSPNGFNLNVTHQVLGIEIYEDMFAPFITGRITLRDALDLPNVFPFVGEETLRLEFKTPLLEDRLANSGTYAIFKMDDWIRDGERDLIYVLHFMSFEGIVDINKKISKTYSGSVSSIVEKLIVESDALESAKSYVIEEAPAATKYTSNFWTPTQNITYLTQQAQTAGGTPGFTFFENRGGFVFASLETIYTGDIYQTFVWDNYTAETGPNGSSKTDLLKEYKRILEYSVPTNFNYVDRLKSGMFGGQLITYDLTTKKYTHTGYLPVFDNEVHLNYYFPQSENLIHQGRAVLIKDSRYYNNFEGYGDVTNTTFLQRRMHLMAAAESSKIEIVVAGRSDYTVGQKVSVRLPLHASIEPKETDAASVDKLLSGQYIIAALCHKLTRDKHECVLQLIKDSLILDLNHVERS